MKVIKSILFFLLVSGCGYSKITANAGAREQMLQSSCEQLAKNLYWSDYAKIMPLFSKEVFPRFVDQRKKSLKDAKVVSVDIGDLNREDNQYKVKVNMEVKYFKAPFYNVETKTETYSFRYDRFGDGWTIEDFSLN